RGSRMAACGTSGCYSVSPKPIRKPRHGSRDSGKGSKKFGWFEGRNVRFNYRYAPAGSRVQELARELIALQPEVILAQGTPISAALKQETRTIPVVFVGNVDPVGSGFVASLARPGGNLTGFMGLEASITVKWLAMLKGIAPGLMRCTGG